MKQLSIRLFAPLMPVATIATRISQFSARQITLVRFIPQRLIGKWRLYLNYCPECNSCAPKLHHCEVCNADTKAYFSWSEEIKKSWWKKYTAKHHVAG